MPGSSKMPPLSVLKPAPKAHSTHKPAVMTASHVVNQALSMGLLNRYQKNPSMPTEKNVEMTPQVMAQAMLQRECKHFAKSYGSCVTFTRDKKNHCRKKVFFVQSSCEFVDSDEREDANRLSEQLPKPETTRLSHTSAAVENSITDAAINTTIVMMRMGICMKAEPLA